MVKQMKILYISVELSGNTDLILYKYSSVTTLKGIIHMLATDYQIVFKILNEF